VLIIPELEEVTRKWPDPASSGESHHDAWQGRKPTPLPIRLVDLADMKLLALCHTP
jgi:hypothetical protein